MANLPNLPLNNTTPTLADAQRLQKQLIEKQFNSSMIFPDRIYETVETSLGFALDWYLKNPVAPLTLEQVYNLAELASDPKAKEARFYIDYDFDYSDITVLPDINAGSKSYVGQTYLADDMVTLKRRLVQYAPILSVGQDIESSIYAVYTNDVPYTFQSFRLTGLDSVRWKAVIEEIVAAYVANFTIVDLLHFEYNDRMSNRMTDSLKASRDLLSVIK